MEPSLAHGAMCIFVEREIFGKVGGLDETIRIAEDHHFVRQAKKFGRFGILHSPNVSMSTRRFEKDGWFKTYVKFVLCELHMIFVGPVRSDIFKYRFSHYSKKKSDEKTLL